ARRWWAPSKRRRLAVRTQPRGLQPCGSVTVHGQDKVQCKIGHVWRAKASDWIPPNRGGIPGNGRISLIVTPCPIVEIRSVPRWSGADRVQGRVDIAKWAVV